MENYKVLPKYPKMDLSEFYYDLSTPGIEPVAPAIKSIGEGSTKQLQIDGSAVFLNDKMVGFLGDYESMNTLAVRNKLNGGLIYLDKNITYLGSDLVLEVFNSSTKIKPRVKEGKVTVDIIVKPKLGVAETDTDLDFTNMDIIEQLEKKSGEFLEKDITKTIQTVQEKYKSDIFGLGYKINISLPTHWKSLKEDWSNNFSELDFTVKVEPEITGSGVSSKPLRKE